MGLACGTVMIVYGASMFRVVLAFAGFYIGFGLVSAWLGTMTAGPSPGVQTLIAVVLGDNVASRKLFLKNGYTCLPTHYEKRITR